MPNDVLQQPYCMECSDSNPCAEIMDADCVIYHPDNDKPSKLNNLALPNNSKLSDILEKVDSFLGNNANIPITEQNSNSVILTATGVAKHTLKADLKVSPDINNQLEVRPNGVFAKPYNENYLVKVNASDIPDFLENQIIGGTDGIVSISKTVESGQVKVSPSIDISCLLIEIKNNPALLVQFCQLLDMCKCFITITNSIATYSAACPAGYTLVGGVCQQINTVAATPSGTTYNFQTVTNSVWSKAGALVYVGGFNINGSGIGGTYAGDIGSGDVVEIYTPDVWLNGTSTPFGGGNTAALGPMNRCGVWTTPYNATTTFVVPVNVPITKTYYIGLGVDNVGSISVTDPNGVTTNLLSQNTSSAGAYFLGSITWNFDFWHIYPVQLQQGINFITVSATDSGSGFGFGVEIYDNTIAELQAAALAPAYISSPGTYPLTSNPYSNLNLVFTSRCARQAGAISANSATCPPGYILDPTTGSVPTAPCQSLNNPISNWTCKQVLNSPFTGYTATIVWDRIPQAGQYIIQQKLSGDPDSSYVPVTGSPVLNPTSGSTVTLVLTGLTTNDYVFRMKADYGSCQSEWVEPTVIIA